MGAAGSTDDISTGQRGRGVGHVVHDLGLVRVQAPLPEVDGLEAVLYGHEGRDGPALRHVARETPESDTYSPSHHSTQMRRGKTLYV